MCADKNEVVENTGLAGDPTATTESPETGEGAATPAGTPGDVADENDKESEEMQEANPLAVLEQAVKTLTEKNQDLSNRLLRALADYDNVRKRTEREVWNAKQYGSEDMVKKMLPVIDSFESALKMMTDNHVDKKVLDGLEMLFMQFSDILEKEGLKPMKARGEKFDPNRHEALMKRSDPELGDDVIVTELEKGYFFKEKVLRPAKVEINQH